jgi:hypothetical protein
MGILDKLAKLIWPADMPMPPRTFAYVNVPHPRPGRMFGVAIEKRAVKKYRNQLAYRRACRGKKHFERR